MLFLADCYVNSFCRTPGYYFSVPPTEPSPTCLQFLVYSILAYLLIASDARSCTAIWIGLAALFFFTLGKLM